MDAALRALNRFGLGARIGERERIAHPQDWLRTQLNGGAPSLDAPPGSSPAEIAGLLRELRGRRQLSQEERRRITTQLGAILAAEASAALQQRVRSDRPYVERLVAFWSNHLCISARAKVVLVPLAGSYERDVIRRHVLGRFEDMVLASAKHPAMLQYLDNVQSVGPSSPAARISVRGNAARGLNENYARELLELHTLGVDGGYTQQDVLELARLLTGWSIAGLGAARDRDNALEFAFLERQHEPGTKMILGEQYGTGVAEGERAIRALCRHPSTARFIAAKLVTHFVSDVPPASAVDRIASVFLDTRGDLRAVSAALIELPEAWSADAVKFRTPQDWLVAVLRAFDVPQVNRPLLDMMRQLRHPLWSPQSPKGFGDSAQEWADPDSLLNRAELARTLSRRIGERAPDPRVLLDVVDDAAPLRALLADSSIPRDERIALAIAGPAFQWR